MGDRFKKLYEVKSNQYDEKAIIIVEAGQLLCDTVTNNVFVLLKLKNVRKENVKGVKIALTGYNVEGAAVEEKEYSYLDMIVERNQSFGAKTPVYFDNRLIRSFKVKIIDVVTENGEVVFGVEELKKLPETIFLKDYFGKGEYVEEYNRLVGNQSVWVPMKCGYLWLCSCGKYNSAGDENCYSCGTTFEKELQYLDKEFIASSYAERIEKEKRDSDYNYACSLLTYNSVRKTKEAIKIFERLDGYEDSTEKLKECNDLLPKLEKKEASEKVVKDKKRKKDLTIFSLAACALVAVIVTISVICVNADKNNRYQKALNDLENGYIEEACEGFLELGKYKDAANYVAQIKDQYDNLSLLEFTYDSLSDSYTVTDAATSIKNAIIPATYRGMPIKMIGEEAFSGCESLRSITIPDSVTSIGKFAFRGCSRLTRVYISDICAWCNLDTESGGNPLIFAHNLYLDNVLVTDLVIPNTVTTIKDYAFYEATCLKSVTISDSVTSIGEYAFCGCSGLTDITIPDGVTSVGWSAFYDTSIEKACLPALACSAFHSNKLKDVVITSGNTIKMMAFDGCGNLTAITIPKSITSIELDAFKECSKLKKVYYCGTLADWSKIIISSSNKNLTNATIYYYSAVKPTANGNYWRYVNGEIIEW